MVHTVRIQPDPGDETRHAEQRTYQQQQTQATSRANLISSIATGIAGVTLISLIIYACITYGQLNEAKVSNSISRDALVSVQRAFVSFVKIQEERTPGLKKDHIWRISAIVENSGTTPAALAINYVNMGKMQGEPDENQFKGNETSPLSTSIGPRATQGLTEIEQSESFIMGKDLGDLNQMPTQVGDEPLYIWGWVAYRDIFKAPHVTEFCLEAYEVQIDIRTKVAKLNLSNCLTHNCIDEYCRDFQAIAALMPPPTN
jgi:hypothetical protein